MSISTITGPARVSIAIATPTPPDPSDRRGPSPPAVEFDEATGDPLPPRFPWLSRLSHQLEAAAPQRPAFAGAPIIGERLNRSA